MQEHGADRPAPRVHVLVADDENVMIQTLTTILDLSGYEMCAVYDGPAALQLLELLQPDLIVTNLNARSPELEPDLLCQAQPHRCKILLYTGVKSLQMLMRGKAVLSLPFNLVPRPLNTMDLLTALRKSFCTNQPPLLVPMEADGNQVH